MEFVLLSVLKIFRNEFNLADFVVCAAFGRRDDGEETPVRLVDGFFQTCLQFGLAGVRVSGGNEVIHKTEKVGAIAGAHKLEGGSGLCATDVEWLAAGGISFAALAGAQ